MWYRSGRGLILSRVVGKQISMLSIHGGKDVTVEIVVLKDRSERFGTGVVVARVVTAPSSMARPEEVQRAPEREVR